MFIPNLEAKIFYFSFGKIINMLYHVYRDIGSSHVGDAIKSYIYLPHWHQKTAFVSNDCLPWYTQSLQLCDSRLLAKQTRAHREHVPEHKVV